MFWPSSDWRCALMESIQCPTIPVLLGFTSILSQPHCEKEVCYISLYHDFDHDSFVQRQYTLNRRCQPPLQYPYGDSQHNDFPTSTTLTTPCRKNERSSTSFPPSIITSILGTYYNKHTHTPLSFAGKDQM